MASLNEASQLDMYVSLKRSLLDFVLDAGGDLATSLETFSAEQAKRWSNTKPQGISRTDLTVDMFLTEGQVGSQSVLDIFIANTPNLSAEQQRFIQSWQQSFNGCFAVQEVEANRFVLMNWLTEKRYIIYPNQRQTEAALNRLAPGEIVITRLTPISNSHWTFSGPMLLLGKLGKPKLAVAIGNFKTWFPQHLYGDAPELLEAAWRSVARYYQEFVEFFGSDQPTLPGHVLNKKLQDYQDLSTQQQLSNAGLDSSKSLQDIAKDAGISDADLEVSIAEMGEEAGVARQLLKSQKALKMIMPTVTLPDELRQADAVTALAHPRWGQTFLNDYTHLLTLLTDTHDEAETEQLDSLVLKYLKTPSINVHVWQCLANQAPVALEHSLQRVLEQPQFNLESDLEAALAQFDKPLTPPLPDMASVPLHLHNLFQEAMQEVSGNAAKSAKKKSKVKGKRKTGFGP